MDFIRRIGFLILVGLAGTSYAQGTFIPGELIVQLQPGAKLEQVLVMRMEKAKPVFWVDTLSSEGHIYNLSFQPADRVLTVQWKNLLQKHAAVKSVQFNHNLQWRANPNDPEFVNQWDMSKILAPAAWNITTGGATATGDRIVVAVIDNGFDINHEDLAGNLWVNAQETPGDGLDNDNNGYVDDVHGWNFADTTAGHLPKFHGTAVSGIIGAKGDNGVGVAGVNWNVSLMFFSVKNIANIIAAYDYVRVQRQRYNESMGKNGAFVVATNLSVGVDKVFCRDQPTWGEMYDKLGAVGVLSAGGAPNKNWNIDEVGDMPSTCPSEFLMTVLNTNQLDKKHSGSGYGPQSIDMGAPGDQSFSTWMDNQYGEFNDNSAAIPHLTGAIALLYSIPCEGFAGSILQQPVAAANYVKSALLQGVDLLPDLQEKTVTGGRLNILQSLLIMDQSCEDDGSVTRVLNVAPNPVNADFNLSVQGAVYADIPIQIFNALGQVVYRNQLKAPHFAVQNVPVNAGEWPRGIYIARAGSAQKSQGFIFIKY